MLNANIPWVRRRFFSMDSAHRMQNQFLNFKKMKTRAYGIELSRAKNLQLSLATRKSIAVNAYGTHLNAIE
jgi:hypothetical protein